MESLYFLIPISVVVCLIGVALFFWAVKSGQYDDLDAEGERVLFEEDIVTKDGSAKLVQQQESGSAKNENTDREAHLPKGSD